MHSGFRILVCAPDFSILVIQCSGIPAFRRSGVPLFYVSVQAKHPAYHSNSRDIDLFWGNNLSKRVKSFQPFYSDVAIKYKVFITSVYAPTVDGQRFASCTLKWLAVSATWIVEWISLQKVPPASFCVWNAFGNISCDTDTVLGKVWKKKPRFQVPRAKLQCKFKLSPRAACLF